MKTHRISIEYVMGWQLPLKTVVCSCESILQCNGTDSLFGEQKNVIIYRLQTIEAQSFAVQKKLKPASYKVVSQS